VDDLDRIARAVQYRGGVVALVWRRTAFPLFLCLEVLTWPVHAPGLVSGCAARKLVPCWSEQSKFASARA
jgi:hypothetical protein